MDHDLVIIAARSVDAMCAQLIGLGIIEDKIAAYYASHSRSLTRTANLDIKKLNEFGIRICDAAICTMYLYPKPDDVEIELRNDFVRDCSFLLCANRIHGLGVQGAIAEVGVYQGDQAALLNRLFPDRALHLFDTFEGFSKRDMVHEQNQSFSQARTGEFSNTSVQVVLSKLPHANAARIHQGYFPDTTAGVDDLFAFLSIAVDLYGPALAGLEWFFPRLSSGGYIFVHDYNKVRYRGVKGAVDKFLEGTHAAALPLPDFADSIVIVK